MAQIVSMPKLGLTMTQATITAWLKKEGDAVAAGETLCEIETDKITSPVESTAEGVLLKILADEFEEKEIAEPLCVVGQPGERWQDALLAAQPPEERKPDSRPPEGKKPAAQQSGARAPGRVPISPVAKRLAEENGLDHTTITGSGTGGRIEKKDVERLLERQNASAGTAPAASGEPAIVKRIPLAGPRKVAAEMLAACKRDVPHAYFTVTVDATTLLKRKESASAAGRTKLSLNDVIIKDTATALAEFPEVNATLVGNEIVCYGDVNIGVAVNTDRGLLVPVIRQANRMSLPEIAGRAGELVSSARAGTLALKDLSGGTFTVSNLGAYGVEEFSAIVNPPQAAILAVGKAANAPCVVEGALAIRPLMRLTLSVDHRVVDGALAAAFLRRLKEIMEANP